MRIFAKLCVGTLLASFLVYGLASRRNPNAPAGEPRPIAIIQGPTVVGTGGTWAVISWTTNRAGRGRSVIYAGTNKNDLRPMDQTPRDAGAGDSDIVASYQEQEYSHLVRVNNLKPGTTYYFVAISGRGIESRSGIAQFSTTEAAPEAARPTAVAGAKGAALLQNGSSSPAQAKFQNEQNPPLPRANPRNPAMGHFKSMLILMGLMGLCLSFLIACVSIWIVSLMTDGNRKAEEREGAEAKRRKLVV